MGKSDESSDAVQYIVSVLQDEIVSGQMTPGTFLAQEALAERFKTSRMPIREVLKQLQALGFVTAKTNKRAYVAATSKHDFLEIYDMRIAVEALAIRSAIPQLTNVQIDRAADVQQEIESAPHKKFGALNTKFHMLLYTPSDRPRLLELIQNLGNAADRYTFMCTVDQSFHDKSNREHHELLAHCKTRDADAAAACIERHIGDARDLFAPMFDN